MVGKEHVCDKHKEMNVMVNDVDNKEPNADCDCYVASGPGYESDKDAESGPGVKPLSPAHDDDQDETHGPGVQ